jgi:hypothetical protein
LPGSIPGASRFYEINGSGKGPLNLVRITDELLEIKIENPV